MNNSTEHNTMSVDSTYSYSVSLMLVVLGAIIVIYVVFANSVLIACFIINRNRTWNGFTRQVFNLAISDLLVGLSGIPQLVTSDIDIETPHSVCVFSFYIFFAAQSGTLFNILAICLQRALILRNRLPAVGIYTAARNVAILIGAWALSMLICILPFVFFGSSVRYNNICEITSIFGNDFSPAVRLLGASYLLPLIFTNLLYACACLRLRCVSSRTIMPAPGSVQSATGSGTNQMTRQEDAGNRVIEQISLRRQRQVFGTVGLLLLLLNLFTLPIILLVVFERGGHAVSRDVKWFASITFMFNSAVNPAVYAYRIDSIRNGLRRMWSGCWTMVFH